MWMPQRITSQLKHAESRVQPLAYGVMILACVIAVVTHSVSLWHYVEFRADQVRDAYVYADMARGVWPTLGPTAIVGHFSIPPLYYYVVFPFTLLSLDPMVQVLPNALCSVLTVPLIMLVVYRFLPHIQRNYRLLLSALGGLWWACLFQSMYWSTREWNPSSVPFFLLLFIVLSDVVYTQRKRWADVLLWSAYGVLLAVIVSLHTITWFIMPAVWLVVCVLFALRTRRWWLPVIGSAVSFLALLPYWYGELQRDFANTRLMWSIVTASKDSSTSVLASIDHAVQSYFTLGDLVYFTEAHVAAFAALFLSVALLGSVYMHRGNARMAVTVYVIFFIYLYSAANFTEAFWVHYTFPIMYVPIVWTMVLLAAVPFRGFARFVAVGGLCAAIVASIATNATALQHYFESTTGTDRMMNTRDIAQALESVPMGSQICGKQSELDRYAYIDQFVSHRQLTFVSTCAAGYYAIFSEYPYHEDTPNPFAETGYTGTLVTRNTVYSVYQVTQ